VSPAYILDLIRVRAGYIEKSMFSGTFKGGKGIDVQFSGWGGGKAGTGRKCLERGRGSVNTGRMSKFLGCRSKGKF